MLLKHCCSSASLQSFIGPEAISPVDLPTPISGTASSAVKCGASVTIPF